MWLCCRFIMGPKKKHKPDKPVYQVRSPRNRGHISALSSTSFTSIAAIVSANNACFGKKFVSAANLITAANLTRAVHVKAARSALSQWMDSGSIPPEALVHFQSYPAAVIDKIPFVRDEVLKANFQSSESVLTSDTRTDEDGLAPVVRDLLQAESSAWENVDQAVIVGQDSFDQTRQKVLDLLDLSTIQLLHGTNRTPVKLSFVRIFQHWCVDNRITHEAATKLLKLLKRHQPDIKAEYPSLPGTAKTLLKLYASDLEGVTGPHDVFDHRNEWKGTYIHYGVEKGVYGDSAGDIFFPVCNRSWLYTYMFVFTDSILHVHILN